MLKAGHGPTAVSLSVSVILFTADWHLSAVLLAKLGFGLHAHAHACHLAGQGVFRVTSLQGWCLHLGTGTPGCAACMPKALPHALHDMLVGP